MTDEKKPKHAKKPQHLKPTPEQALASDAEELTRSIEGLTGTIEAEVAPVMTQVEDALKTIEGSLEHPDAAALPTEASLTESLDAAEPAVQERADAFFSATEPEVPAMEQELTDKTSAAYADLKAHLTQ